MLRIAYFSPLPPTRTGIADYSAELLPYLGRRAEVTLFVEQPEQVACELRERFSLRSLSEFGRLRWHYDVAVYQMGNSLYHDAMYATLLDYPGISVLHDYGLHHFVAARTVSCGNFAGYVREMGYALGSEGVRLARQIRRGERGHPFLEVALNERLLDSSLGVIVHSLYAQRRIQAQRALLPVCVVPAPIQQEPAPLLSRRELGLPDDALVFASAGQITGAKQVMLALEAFARLRDAYPHALYVVIGEELEPELDLQSWLRVHDLQEAVVCTGYVESGATFLSWIAAADVLVNLRYPSVGETSATALRGLAGGRPVIVSDVGWYSELPGDVCVKVSPNDGEALFSAMRGLAQDKVLRREIGQKAAAHARQEHSAARAAERYLDFIDQVLARGPGSPGAILRRGAC